MLNEIWTLPLESLINLRHIMLKPFCAKSLALGWKLRPKNANFRKNRLKFSHGWWRHHDVIMTLNNFYYSLRHNSILYLRNMVFEFVLSIIVPDILVPQNGYLIEISTVFMQFLWFLSNLHDFGRGPTHATLKNYLKVILRHNIVY